MRLARALTGPLLASPTLARVNWRGRLVTTSAGILLPVVLVAIVGGLALANTLGAGSVQASPTRLLVVATAAGFALLGLVDDLLGTAADKGFRGHLRALAQGRATTGTLKLFGGAALALVVAAPLAGTSAGRLLADAALIALAANLGNLLDRAPGRVIKAALVGLVALAIVARARFALEGVAVVVGAAAGLLLDDLHEHLMLGDAGANALGAVLGLGVVVAGDPALRTGTLVAVAGLNVLGEAVSFSRVIDAVPPLRALDHTGRRP